MGCLPNQRSGDLSGVEGFQSELWTQESHRQGTGNRLIITSAQGGKLLKYKRREYLVLSKRPLEHFPPFGLTLHFHLQREALGVRCIIICSAFSFARAWGKGYFQLTPPCQPGVVLKSNRTLPTSRASHFHPWFSPPRTTAGFFCLYLSCLRLAKVFSASGAQPFDSSFRRCEFGTQIPPIHLPWT